MTAVLVVPYRDACAADLRLTFDLARRPALRVTRVALGELDVELCVLGASHQVLVSAADRLVAAETVACGLAGGPLPAVAEGSSPHHRLRFRSGVRSLRGACFAGAVNRLTSILDHDPRSTAAVFPGDELALTGLRVWHPAPGRVAWRTWHAYPRTRELVSTVSDFRVNQP